MTLMKKCMKLYKLKSEEEVRAKFGCPFSCRKLRRHFDEKEMRKHCSLVLKSDQMKSCTECWNIKYKVIKSEKTFIS